MGFLLTILHFGPSRFSMLPPMKSTTMKSGAKPMSKSAITKKLAEQHGLKQKASSNLLASFVEIATKEVKKTGIFNIPGLCRIKTRVKPATKAGVRNIFGKEVKVAAKPAKKIVKAYCAAPLKKSI